MFTAAIFDMDGLLIDSERAIMRAWMAAAHAEGVVLTEADYLPIIGRPMAVCHARLTEMLGGEAAFLRARMQVQAQLAATSPFPLKQGTIALLEALARHDVPCGVASSTASAEVRRRLDAAGILPFFQALAGGDEVACGKPDPAVYLLAAQRLGHSPAQCLAFEDSHNGMRAACAAGIAVVVVPDLVEPDTADAFATLKTLDHAMHHLADWFPAKS